MRTSKFYAAFIFFISSIAVKGQDLKIIVPAEWQPQQSVFVSYAGNPGDAVNSNMVHSVSRNVVRELARTDRVYVLINTSYKTDSLQKLFASQGINTGNIKFVPVEGLFGMGVPRDYGPLIIKDGDGKNKIIRFHWDYVGADFINVDPVWAKQRDRLRDSYFSQVSKILQMEVLSSPLTLEGGEIEMNGKGVALMVDSFNLPRNPQFNKQQVDSLLMRSLGVKKTIWLNQGVAEDPGVGTRARIKDNLYGYGVGGHVDEFARFVDCKTIFLAMPTLKEAITDPVKKISYDRMKVNETILKQSTDQDGKPFTIVYIPVPDVNAESHTIDTSNFTFPIKALRADFPEWKHGEKILFTPAVSYLNFLIFNQIVLIPKYWRKGFPESCKKKDKQVKKIFEAFFPGKTIVQIDPWGINRVGGGIHCWTQQVAAD